MEIEEIKYEKGPPSKVRLGPAEITIIGTLDREDEDGSAWIIKVDAKNVSNNDVMNVLKSAQEHMMKKMHPDLFDQDGKPDIGKAISKLTELLMKGPQE